jgi:hypothetical protein
MGSKMVASQLLKKLIFALREPSIPEPSLSNLGITREWLVENHEPPQYRYQGGPEGGTPNQRALYQKWFDDEAFVSKRISVIYKSGGHTDDYPSVKVELNFEDGTVVSASSRSQQPFMLPWEVDLGGEKFLTYNANISRALTAILPKKTVNRSRISGDGLLDVLRTDVIRAIEPEENLLDANNRAAVALAKLGRHYTIVRAEINEYHHVEYGIEWRGNQPHETNLHVSLKRPDLPPNLEEAVVLEYRGGKTEGVEAFLREMNKYERLLLSVPWLVDYIRANKKVVVRLSFVHDASFGDKARKVFVGDMKALGKDRLATEILEQESEIALLIIGWTYAEAYWLVLPDKRMLLWRYNGPSGLLKWNAADVKTSECADYGEPFGGCVGVMVDADGNLTH